ncbi:hypothetical protein HAP41_0000005845 [Bradyrhizobium barranii subsp. apii]|uniref:Uncharacterized protein n=1 Tax=Bradyrhizobium barranii subsp. apii TaxID=2819348 RepID=A0A8T5VGD6_9BRAD|nr:hypothetical protein [Bradyrhizobium barranii]UPT88605.1 hypothetical protein HAP41_0000005845 [Bradyrhizobium barranii subsp. apii]
MKQLVRHVTALLESQEQRQRARRPDDQQNHVRAVEGVICNLAYAILNPPLPTGWLATDTRNGERGKGRYDNPAFGTTYRNLLAQLEANGVLHRQTPAAFRGERHSIRPTSRFGDMVRSSGISFADFGADPAREVVLLRRVKRSYSPETGRPRKDAKQVDYEDTSTSRAYRAAVRELNAFLDQADIAFLDDGLEPVVDPHSRTLTRRFTIFDEQELRFDQVGRLFGGFWLSLKKERRKQIRINGEPVIDLDYQSMFTRLAYADLCLQPPAGDLYAIPGLEAHRSGVKLAMNCFLFDETPKRRTWPQDMGFSLETGADIAGADTIQGKLPDGWTVNRTKKAILTVHPALERAWGRGLGYRLMWQESEILLAVLRELMEQNIPALGLHDGLLVPLSRMDTALEVMRHQSKAIVGVELPCSVKA